MRSSCPSKALTANLVLLVVAILDTGHEDGSLVREDQALAVFAEVAVTSPQDGVKHALVEEEVAHPLGDDDVDLRERQLDLLHLALEQCDLVRHAIDLDDLLSLVDDGGHVDANDVLGAGLDGEHAENGGSTADVEDDLILEQVGVVVDGIAVALGADLIFLRRGSDLCSCVGLGLNGSTDQHLLVNTVVVVAVEVVPAHQTVSDSPGAICISSQMRRTLRCEACRGQP